ncbi:MAG: sigma-70 family RNA polymerase sigma factor [Anaerolineaceae bacterium]|nr:sigma-70 family RNA polymerase sigma factor [Anaerolineaceae bacterium]
MSNSEQEWLEEALNGNDDAFTRLVETYQNPVYNLCYRMLGEGTAAEDAAQETFWRAYQNLKKYDRQRSFITWLLSIAAHFCIDQQRKRRLPLFELDEFPDLDVVDISIPNPEKEYSHNQERDALHGLINQLNPQDRAAVILKYWYDCSEEEISQMLSLTISAVKSRLHRSRRQLAEMLSTEQDNQLNERRTHESPAL